MHTFAGRFMACVRAGIFYGLGVSWSLLLLTMIWLMWLPPFLGGRYFSAQGMRWWSAGILLFAGIWRIKREGVSLSGNPLRRIIIANHSSFLDILLLFRAYPHKLLFVISGKVRRGRLKFFGWFAKKTGHIFINEEGWREKARQFLLASDTLEPRAIAIFPEGRRSLDGKIDPQPMNGWSSLAKETGLEVQAVALLGVNEVLPRGASWPLRWQSVTVRARPTLGGDFFDLPEKSALLFADLGLELAESKRGAA